LEPPIRLLGPPEGLLGGMEGELLKFGAFWGVENGILELGGVECGHYEGIIGEMEIFSGEGGRYGNLTYSANFSLEISRNPELNSCGSDWSISKYISLPLITIIES